MKFDDKILIQYLDNKLPDEKNQEVDDWCNQSPENKKYLKDIYNLQRINNISDAYIKADAHSSFKRFNEKINQREVANIKKVTFLQIIKKYGPPLAAFIAGIIITSGIIFFNIKEHLSNTFMAHTDGSQRSELILPDGTKVWLNAKTDIEYKHSYWGTNRELKLNGEAYLEVQHNENKPFIVTTKKTHVTVLGTKFNVRSKEGEDETITTLLEGSVAVKNTTSDNAHIIHPGQSIITNNNNGDSEIFAYNKPLNILLWRCGNLDFENASLIEIMETLEQHFNIGFKFKNKQLEQETYTCSFSTNDKIEYILNILTLTEKFKYTLSDNTVHIY